MAQQQQQQQQHVVFVFGTLKRKEPNHRVMDDIKATFIGTGRTALRQRLSLDERYGIPYLFMPTEAEEGHHVHGEVYLCDDAAVAFLVSAWADSRRERGGGDAPISDVLPGDWSVWLMWLMCLQDHFEGDTLTQSR